MAEFITKKENQRRLATLIVCLILTALALTLGIYAIKKTGDIEQKPENPENLIKLREAVKAQREANVPLEDAYYAFPKLLGWRKAAAGPADRFDGTGLEPESLKNYLSGWAVKLREFGITKYKRWDDPGTGENLLLTILLDELINKEKEYVAKIAEMTTLIENERAREKQAAEQTGKEADVLTKKLQGDVKPEQPAQGLIGDLIKHMKDFNALQKAHSEELGPLEIDAVAKMKEATDVKNENVRRKAGVEDVKAGLRTRIYTIQHHREEARERREPDGEILAVKPEREICYINLLRQNRLFKGTRFRVYSLERGGVKMDKGDVEVVEVRDALSSVCSILRTYDPTWPLKSGDKIYNEFYEGGKPRYIAFAGRFTGKLSNEEAAAVIREFGDHYQEKVDDKTNYVVVSEGYEEHPNYKAALDMGVKILIEKYLYDYLGVPK